METLPENERRDAKEMRRRESHSEKVLKHVVAVDGQQQGYHGRDMRRSSEPRSYHRSIISAGCTAGQPQNPLWQSQNTFSVAPPPPNSMLSQCLQGHALGQTSARNHSFVSSMDLISPSSSNADSAGKVFFQPFQSHLFRSSSHHTSHTAAAGDLLTMSRRALDPLPPIKINGTTKKRSSTMVDGSAGQFNLTSMNGGNSQMMMTGQTNHSHLHQSNHAPEHNHLVEQMKVLSPNSQEKPHFGDQNPSAFQETAYVSSSGIGPGGDKEESYQQHRTIRRCYRPDSFEMMEDS